MTDPAPPTYAYVKFVQVPDGGRRRTLHWDVLSTTVNSRLGRVCWHTHWRCYSFYPDWSTIFEKTCLRDIADFIELQTRNHLRRRAVKGKDMAAR